MTLITFAPPSSWTTVPETVQVRIPVFNRTLCYDATRDKFLFLSKPKLKSCGVAEALENHRLLQPESMTSGSLRKTRRAEARQPHYLDDPFPLVGRSRFWEG
jgi:hypothetical protein